MRNFEKIKRKRDHGPHVPGRMRKQIPRCRGKHSYRTEELAERVRAKRQALLDYRLYVYQCIHYDAVPVVHWHLTHKKQWGRVQ